MRLHLTYIQTDLADCCSDFIVERQGQVLDAVTARARDYSALSIIKVLHPLTGGAATFTELYRDSKIRMKKSFIAYLHLCRSYNFIRREQSKRCAYYSLTDRGRTILNLFMEKGD